MTIRLILDARKIFDGGIGVYTRNLIEALARSTEFKLCLLINPHQKNKILAENFSWLNLVDWKEDLAKVLSLDEYFNLTKRIDFTEFDLYHTPFITIPRNLPIPSVITIHDLIQITHPEKFYYPLIAKLIIGNSIKQATGVLTVSKSSAGIIKKYFHQFVANKLTIIPNVISQNFRESSKEVSTIKNPRIEAKKFIMALFSNLKPHKGCLDLLKVFSQLILKQQIPKDFYLVLVGKELEKVTNPHVQKILRDYPQIINLGALSDAELVSTMAQAEALVVPSLVEGFSLPVLQAHSQGTPVIVRPIPAIQELIGNGDVVAVDFSQESLAKAILKFYEQDSRKKYSYELSNYDLLSLSDKLLDYYRKILSNESSIST